MSNVTSCAATSNCTILDGPTTNGTFYVTGYDPSAHVPYWHQRLELAVFCIFNPLSLIIISARVWYRWASQRRFRGDDRWMTAAGFFLIAYTASQIGTNIYGSGLHMKNVHAAWLDRHWHFELGWAGYYVVVSLIKISVCFTFIEILPQHFIGLRYAVYSLALFVACLGITMTFSWVFECTPFLSNFLWSDNATSCVNYDYFRWMWIGFSLPIDFLIVAVPWRLLKRTQLQQHERKILRWVFSANFLGTITCALGIYGVYETRTSELNDAYYQEAVFLMMNDIEIFMYALGASFPVLSRHLVARSDPLRETHSNFSSWARNIPDFFLPEPAAARTLRGSRPTEYLSSQLSVKPFNGRSKSDEHMYHDKLGVDTPESESSHSENIALNAMEHVMSQPES